MYNTNFNPSDNSLLGSGRSPDANDIYNQYLAYYADAMAKLAAINAKYPAGDNSPAAVEARAAITALIAQITQTYQNDYNNSSANLDQFKKDCADFEAKITDEYNKAMGGNPPTPPTPNGRSKDADAIYQQYLAYYAAINALIEQINAKYPGGKIPPYAQKDKDRILALQKELADLYQKDYNDSSATLQDYQNAYADIKKEIDAAFTDAMGGGNDIQKEISDDLDAANALVAQLQAQLAALKASLDNLNKDLAAKLALIKQLEDKINSLPNGADKDKAIKDLAAAKQDVSDLQNQITAASSAISTCQADLDKYLGPNGAIAALKALLNKDNPTKADLDSANALLAVVRASQNDLAAANTAISQAQSASNKATKDIQTVQNDLNPTPPPTPGKIENGVWYIDWTTWFNGDFKIPDGVTTINIFVGEISIGPDGKPTMGGFGNMTPAQMDKFVAACHNHNPPIDVKVSIGGHGGSYDNCWDCLTPGNVKDFAKMMSDYCHAHGLSGIDFDYEKDNPTTDQEKLVGELIREFKADGKRDYQTDFKTSVCTNASFDAWSSELKTILDASIDPETGKCSVDRVYIMAYFDSATDEEAWITKWADMLEKDYGFSPDQISVGIDDTSPANNQAELQKWAEEHGYSICHWEYDPAHPTALKDGLFDRDFAPNETFSLAGLSRG